MERNKGNGTVVGYPRHDGERLTDLLSRTAPSPAPVWPLVAWLALGVFPLCMPFTAWATVRYWRAPRSQRRWRIISAVLLTLEVANFAGFLIYGYGRHYGIG